MFIGHFAVALAAKKAAPKTSLGTLAIAVTFVDLLWPVFLLLGVEHVRIDPGNTAFTPLDFYDYPISHSLLTTIGWSIGFGLVYYVLRHSIKSALILAGCVASHWVLDFISHRPDMPLMPGVNKYVGLGLWNSVPATIIVEGAIFAIGILIYLRSTTALDRTGRYAFWSFVVFLVLAWLGSAAASPPPNVTALAIGALSAWLLIVWTYWIDRHRRSTSGLESSMAPK
jgi:hypothetical protein